MSTSNFNDEGESSKSRPQASGSSDKASAEQEKQWILRALQGDPGALEKLYENHIDRVYRYTLRKTGNKADAEALTSETFTRAIAALVYGHYKLQGRPFGAWLIGIAHHIYQEWQRDQGKRSETIPLEDLNNDLHAGESEDVLEAILAREKQDSLWQLVGELPLPDQKILNLRYKYSLPYAEIAKRLSMTENACKQRHHRALLALRQKVKQSWSSNGM